MIYTGLVLAAAASALTKSPVPLILMFALYGVAGAHAVAHERNKKGWE